jgi:uncharacterized protein YkwD
VTRSGRVRRSALVGVLTTALTMGVVASASSAGAASPEAKLLNVINHVREQHGLRALQLNVRLSEDAERHTRRMIDRAELFDPPNLPRLLRPYDWRTVGASVSGCDDTLQGLMRRWMAHDEHRDILLIPGLRRAGIGVVFADGRTACGLDQFWATGILYG